MEYTHFNFVEKWRRGGRRWKWREYCFVKMHLVFVLADSILSSLTNSKIICKLQPLESQNYNETAHGLIKWKLATLTSECAHVHVCPQSHGNLRGLLIQPAPALPSLINLPPIYFAKGSFFLHTHRQTEIHSHKWTGIKADTDMTAGFKNVTLKFSTCPTQFSIQSVFVQHTFSSQNFTS